MAVLKYRDGSGWHLLPLAIAGGGGLDQAAADLRYLQLTGGTVTGAVTVPDGTLAGHAATKGQTETYTAGAVAAHAAAADPHTGYQRESERGAANGYAGLDATTKIPIILVPTGSTGTTVALGDHTHPGYAATGTQILGGDGLTGGGDLTGSRTLNVGAGTGITVAPDAVAVDTAVIATRSYVDSSPFAANTVTVTAGAGLTGGGTLAASRSLDVGAGTGITVASDTVAVDTTVIAARSYVDARTPKITVSGTAPSSPATGDVWIAYP